MDKQTVASYGWVVIITIVFAVMLGLATPFGDYVGNALVNISQGYKNANDNSLNKVEEKQEEWDNKFGNDQDNGVIDIFGGGSSNVADNKTLKLNATFGGYYDEMGALVYSSPITLTFDELKLTKNGDKYFYDETKIVTEGVWSNMFMNCTPLIEVVIPSGITSIPDMAFGASSLQKITLPQSITYIGSKVFELAGTSSNSTIIYKGTMTQWNAITKAPNWNFSYEIEGVPYVAMAKVICTDGTILLS